MITSHALRVTFGKGLDFMAEKERKEFDVMPGKSRKRSWYYLPNVHQDENKHPAISAKWRRSTVHVPFG